MLIGYKCFVIIAIFPIFAEALQQLREGKQGYSKDQAGLVIVLQVKPVTQLDPRNEAVPKTRIINKCEKYFT